MSNGFSRTRDGIQVALGPLEATLLIELIGQIDALLEPPPVDDPLEAIVGLRAVAPPPPDDPAVARLLPDAYPDDPDAGADYRRRTSDDLRAGKRAAARRVLATVPATGGRTVLDDDQVQDWLVTLNDLRLVFGTRLNLSDDAPPRLSTRSRVTILADLWSSCTSSSVTCRTSSCTYCCDAGGSCAPCQPDGIPSPMPLVIRWVRAAYRTSGL
ncbi:DUF2017 family protein [Frankia sp. Cr1]|uniref:DUF2017 family protein n=1 Tax=Frankia sp. Cr1 TaxID=3073931 RepID=UPI002AD56462|nr:DUF2017 family protein [Frankia sp. Cr1]